MSRQSHAVFAIAMVSLLWIGSVAPAESTIHLKPSEDPRISEAVRAVVPATAEAS